MTFKKIIPLSAQGVRTKRQWEMEENNKKNQLVDYET